MTHALFPIDTLHAIGYNGIVPKNGKPLRIIEERSITERGKKD